MFKRLRHLGHLIIFTFSLAALIVVAAPRDQLENFKTRIEELRRQGASIHTPMNLRLAESELMRAQQLVHSGEANPLHLEHTLEMVEYRIRELRSVLALIRNSGGTMSEESALRQVRESYPEMSPNLTRRDSLE